MTNKTWSRKFVAITVAAAVLSVYSMLTLATPGARSGELSVNGNVTVNGQQAISGGTIFTDSVIVSPADSKAKVSLGKMGWVELGANSSLKLSFNDQSIMGLLDAGSARVSTPAGVQVNLTTKDGLVMVDGSQATTFNVNTAKGNTVVGAETGFADLRSGTTTTHIAAGGSGVAGTPTPKDNGDDPQLVLRDRGWFVTTILLGTVGAIAVVIWATTHNNNLNFGGTVNVVSPTR